MGGGFGAGQAQEGDGLRIGREEAGTKERGHMQTSKAQSQKKARQRHLMIRFEQFHSPSITNKFSIKNECPMHACVESTSPIARK